MLLNGMQGSTENHAIKLISLGKAQSNRIITASIDIFFVCFVLFVATVQIFLVRTRYRTPPGLFLFGMGGMSRRGAVTAPWTLRALF